MKKYLASSDTHPISDNNADSHSGDSNNDQTMETDTETQAEAPATGSFNELDEMGDEETHARESQGSNMVPQGHKHLNNEEFDGQENNHVNNGLEYITYASDNKDSDHSDYLQGSWYHVPTPLPSPPCSPPPEQDGLEPSEDEDNFCNINAVDYWEYEWWYVEDHVGEDMEMLAETLTDKEIDSIIMLAICQFGTVMQNDYKRIQYSYQHKLQLLSSQQL
ncbi:unnamed protein product [Rhizoctonia solani]|uniref:Uncharacterized protein n=1 Tax=Rhizoctonia solani TaxID=456999 RepID=A0A8H2XZB2_9AGAM|nr:unnamed protein product [Rhizoctonia solani]